MLDLVLKIDFNICAYGKILRLIIIIIGVHIIMHMHTAGDCTPVVSGSDQPPLGNSESENSDTTSNQTMES